MELKNKIEELAGLLTLPDDMALILEVDLREFIEELRQSGTDIHRAFYRGLLKYEISLRKKNQDPVDPDSLEFENTILKDFKSKLLIQLENE